MFTEWLAVFDDGGPPYLTLSGDLLRLGVPEVGDARFALISMGEDGEPGTVDDIVVLGRSRSP